MATSDDSIIDFYWSDLTAEERSYVAKAARWSREHPKEITADDMRLGFDLARLDVYSQLAHLRERLIPALGYHFGAEVYGRLVALGVFELQFGTIRRFDAFKVLMVCLLGKAVVQHLPSLYLAAALHPSILTRAINVEEACDIVRDPEHYR